MLLLKYQKGKAYSVWKIKTAFFYLWGHFLVHPVKSTKRWRSTFIKWRVLLFWDPSFLGVCGVGGKSYPAGGPGVPGWGRRADTHNCPEHRHVSKGCGDFCNPHKFSSKIRSLLSKLFSFSPALLSTIVPLCLKPPWRPLKVKYREWGPKVIPFSGTQSISASHMSVTEYSDWLRTRFSLHFNSPQVTAFQLQAVIKVIL